ncbi:MAG: SdrD B-like domain-containing protein, partial [Clostridium sp.]
YTNKELELKIRTKADQIGKINEIVGKKVAIEKKLFNILVSKFEDETYDKIGEKEKSHYYVDLENLNNNDYRDLKLKFDTTNNVKIKKITIKKAPTLEGVTTSNSNKKDKNNQDKNQTSEFKRTLDNLNSMIGKQLTNQFDNKEDIIKEFNSNNAEVIIPLVQKYTTKGLILEIETQKLDKKVPHDPYIISMKLVEDKDNKEKLLATKDEKGFITKPIIDMKQTVSNSSTYIQEDEEIVYTYDITNFGSQELRYNKFKFVVPKNVGITNIKMYKNNQKYKEYDTGYIKYDGFEETFDLERASRYKIEIRVLIPKNIGVSKSTIKIFAELLDINSKLLAKTNEVTQIIEKGAESRALQQKVLKGEVNLSKSELRDLSIEDTIDKDTKIIRDFEIGGKAWIDTNKNGIYENTEKLLPYITVKLLDNDKKRIISTTETDKNGQYKFEKIPNGNYSVIFEYESEKYDTTIYKKNNLENNVSGAISSKITNGAEEKTIAVSDGININFQSKTGTDLGLKKKSEYDLSLKSKIAKIKLIDKNDIYSENPKVKKEYTINNIINDEVVSIFKNGLKENEALLVTYDVNIINEGTKESKIVSIKKSKRESEKIYDKNWSISNDIIQTKIPEKEQIIKPENTKTIQFKTIYTNEDFKNDGNVEEKFEILSAEYNGGVDADSTANNNIATEDDMSHNMLILDKSRYKNTIIILFSVIISLGITIIILNRFRKYSNKIKLK